jgi:hypothetical protein
MQVHALYEDGRLTFQKPIRLKTQRIELDVTIPDNYILESKQEDLIVKTEIPHAGFSQQIEATTLKSATRARLDAIIGKWRTHGGASGKDVYKAIWHAHLEDKYIASR